MFRIDFFQAGALSQKSATAAQWEWLTCSLWDSPDLSPPYLSLFRPLPFFKAQLKYCPLPLSNPQHTAYLSCGMDQVLPCV